MDTQRRMHPQTIGEAFREAVLAMAAALATMACTLALYHAPGLAVLAVVLCLSLARSQLDRDLRGRLEALLALPAVGLVATAVGLLLLQRPWAGAVLFTAGMAVSIWLRQFGQAARRAGSLMALPLVAILITPHAPLPHASRWAALAAPIVVALLALLWVAAFHWLGRRVGLLARSPAASPRPGTAWRQRAAPGTRRPSATTQMAVQMAVALALAFAVGHAFFNAHWAWVVLTAFIVNSGNRGRLDVAYKSVLRVLGAGFGTVLALALGGHVDGHPPLAVALILGAVFVGTWLRPLGYAWWALFATLALALLQGLQGQAAAAILWPRLEEIVVGAVLGVAAAWWVWPVRSTDVMRRRVADLLACLADAFDPASACADVEDVRHAMAQLAQLAPTFRAMRWATASARPWRPDRCIDTMLACEAPVLVLLAGQATPPGVRRAITTARKALREPHALPAALADLHRALQAATAPAHATPSVPLRA